MAARILVPFDESTQANFALRYALTEFSDDEICVLHVNDPREWSSAGDEKNPLAKEAREGSETTERALLAKAEEVANDYDREIATEVAVGEPASTIASYAERHDFDHVILGTHGRDGLSRLLHGSVAEHVIRQSHVPVTIVRTDTSEDTV